MENYSQKAYKIIKKLFKEIEQLSEEELAKLENDSATIEIRITTRQKRKPAKETSPFEGELSEVVIKLTAFPNREEAQEFLKERFASRKMLEPLARFLEIPVSTQDNLDALREKITESTVGARLRSQAIQGT